MTSYAVIAGDKIIRFREQSATLDVDMMVLAKGIHGDIVPTCVECRSLDDPESSQLIPDGQATWRELYPRSLLSHER
jgi:hypothetical protein